MCGCEQHNDPTAGCTCTCEEHGNFKAVANLARSRWDTIVEMQKITVEKAQECLKEYGRHDWSPRTRLCQCGGFFEASLRGHDEHALHRMLNAMSMVHTITLDDREVPAGEGLNRMAQYLYEELSSSDEIELLMPMTGKPALVNAIRKAMERAL